MNTMECGICHATVDAKDVAEHLTTVHPTPLGGFQFFHDGKPYHTDRPSMLVWELLAFVGETLNRRPYAHLYQFYEEREKEMIPIGHMQAVDLTNGPRRFFSIPPATW